MRTFAPPFSAQEFCTMFGSGARPAGPSLGTTEAPGDKRRDGAKIGSVGGGRKRTRKTSKIIWKLKFDILKNEKIPEKYQPAPENADMCVVCLCVVWWESGRAGGREGGRCEVRCEAGGVQENKNPTLRMLGEVRCEAGGVQEKQEPNN